MRTQLNRDLIGFTPDLIQLTPDLIDLETFEYCQSLLGLRPAESRIESIAAGVSWFWCWMGWWMVSDCLRLEMSELNCEHFEVICSQTSLESLVRRLMCDMCSYTFTYVDAPSYNCYNFCDNFKLLSKTSGHIRTLERRSERIFHRALSGFRV